MGASDPDRIDGPIRCEVKVSNPQGIHARPSQAIVSLAQRFDAEIMLTVEDRSAKARSILSVMTLGAVQGSLVRIRATGPEAAAAVEELVALIRAGFAEG